VWVIHTEEEPCMEVMMILTEVMEREVMQLMDPTSNIIKIMEEDLTEINHVKGMITTMN
jgi:hypothetical protein